MQSKLYQTIALVVKKYCDRFGKDHEITEDNFDCELFRNVLNEENLGLKCTIASASFWQLNLDMNENSMQGTVRLNVLFCVSYMEESIEKQFSVNKIIEHFKDFDRSLRFIDFHVFDYMLGISKN